MGEYRPFIRNAKKRVGVYAGSRAMVYEQPFDEENRVVSDCQTADISHHFIFTCVSPERNPPFSYYFFPPPLLFFLFAFFPLKYSPPSLVFFFLHFFFVLRLPSATFFFFFEIREPIVSGNNRKHRATFSSLTFSCKETLPTRAEIQR